MFVFTPTPITVIQIILSAKLFILHICHIDWRGDLLYDYSLFKAKMQGFFGQKTAYLWADLD
mgnify:CR=1 FL=1